MSKRGLKVVSSATSGKLEPPKTERPPLSLQKATFRLDCCYSGKYCLGKGSNDQLIGFAKTIHHLSRMSWHDIEYGDRKGKGSEKLNNLRKHIPRNLSVPDDVDIIGIRYWRKKRLVGYKDANNAFCIIWADDGSLYDHGR